MMTVAARKDTLRTNEFYCLMENNVKEGNGDCYYEYILVNTDDVVVISENSGVKNLNPYFLLKPESMRETRTYLRASILKHMGYHFERVSSRVAESF